MAQVVEVLAEHSANDNKLVAWPPASQLRVLEVGDYLFKEGTPRNYIYRVEKGVISVFERRIGRPANIIEMASQGDYVGLGCLEHHRDNARAVVDSIVCFLPKSEFALLAERDPKLGQKQAAAIKRDFEHGKRLAHDRGRSAPVECVAAFLAAVSRQNAHDGRDPTIVSDSLKCGVVTTLLDLDIRTLERALLKLRDMGLVEPHPAGGLHLQDIETLERIANGGLQSVEAALDALPAVAMSASPPGVARSPFSLRPGAMITSSWKDELREATCLVSVIGDLSVISVGLAIMFSFAVL